MAGPGRAVGAVVLTGGTARRLGGRDKAALAPGGRPLLRHVLDLVARWPHVVVGDPVPGVVSVREEPPGGGPAAALLAGLAALPPEVEVVLALAVDLPFVEEGTVRRLLGAVEQDGAMLVDADGRGQYLCAAYRRDALVAAAPADVDGLPLRRLLAPLALVEVPAVGHEAHDVDTPDDLARAEEWLTDDHHGCQRAAGDED